MRVFLWVVGVLLFVMPFIGMVLVVSTIWYSGNVMAACVMPGFVVALFFWFRVWQNLMEMERLDRELAELHKQKDLEDKVSVE